MSERMTGTPSKDRAEAHDYAARMLMMKLHGATELGQRTEWISQALADAYDEGMKRATEIAQAEVVRLERLRTEASIIANAIFDELERR